MIPLVRRLEELGLNPELLGTKESYAFSKRWLEMFAEAVKEKHGKYVYRGFRWHGFSYGIQVCTEGADAMSMYLSQWPAPYVIFDEELTTCARCVSAKYPDLTSLHADPYVSHENLKWTMVFTHEQPEIGPFFAERHDSNTSINRDRLRQRG